MSKLADAIQRTQRIEATPMGFGAARPAAKATMLVGLVARDTAAIEGTLADIVLLDLSGSFSKQDAEKARAAAAGRPLGLRLAGLDTAKAKAAREGGIDFILFEPESTPAAALLDETLGYVLALPEAADELFLRSLEPLHLEAIYLDSLPPSLSVARFYMARLYLERGDERGALREIEAGLLFDPRNSEARAMRERIQR